MNGKTSTFTTKTLFGQAEGPYGQQGHYHPEAKHYRRFLTNRHSMTVKA